MLKIFQKKEQANVVPLDVEVPEEQQFEIESHELFGQSPFACLWYNEPELGIMKFMPAITAVLAFVILLILLFK